MADQLELNVPPKKTPSDEDEAPAEAVSKAAATSAPKAKKAPKAKASKAPKPAPSGRPKLYLVDGPNIAFRAHYAIRGLTNSKGFATGALFGYCNMLFKLLKEEEPEYLVLVWDPRGGTFRNDLYPEYKGTRPDMPDELRAQLEYFPQIADAFGITHIVKDRYEADDVIGTLANTFKDRCDVTIVTGDKDMMQLVDEGRVWLLDTMKDQRIGPAEVVAKWGVRPDQIIDILSIMGDTSDNIPGVARIGQKGAAGLIQEWGSMEAAFENAEQVKGRARKPLLAEGAYDSAKLSYELATIVLDVETGLELEDLTYEFPPSDRSKVRDLFQELEFHRFLTELGGEMQSLDTGRYTCVTDETSLRALTEVLRVAPVISIDTETTSVDANRADLVGLSFCVDESEAWYVPVGHTGEGSEGQLPRERVLTRLRAILENPKKRFLGQHLKYDRVVLHRAGIELGPGGGDTMIASYLLNPGRQSHKLDGLALTWLRHKMIPYAEATKDTDGHFAPVPVELATTYAAEDAHVVWKIHAQMVDQIEEADLRPLYDDVEVPLVAVLAEMERTGICLDGAQLEEYSKELAVGIAEAEALCHELAGHEFNTASPKQLRTILFEELGLPVVKKTKTGPSTDASVLEELATMHDLPKAILKYRMLAKLKSTYVDALPPLIHPETGRIHTHYGQTVAATGRLSSNDPNLQNIPIRTAEGRRIRAAFVPDPGHVFLSCDYSQVELRVLAHLCGGEGGFARAFAADEDVHRATAADVFDVPPEEVTTDMRRTAKAINFGLVYGQTDFGLARTLHIKRKEAAAYIDKYWIKYPEVEAYMNETVAFARQHGYVKTLLGRRRPVTDLTSNNFNQRQAARRIAINTPVQGSAADIIKLAMLRVDAVLKADFPTVRMLLQVHDELVFEVPEALVDSVRERVVEEMESAMALSVPLKVDSGVGTNWDEAH
jgi:DNA polymerase I